MNELVSKALNEGKFVGAILIDLQKAFDTVNRKILIQKLEKVGIRGKMLKILDSYLNERTSITKIGNGFSQELNCEDGVPQGSILGPILFLIYINDIEDGIETQNILLFADDIFLLSIHYKYEAMTLNLQNQFDKICEWCVKNDVFLSEDKTVHIVIRTPHMKFNATHVWVRDENLGNTPLKLVNDAKYLGMTLGKNWKHKNHIP